MFLRGVGGVSVGLPLLPSLASSKAYAADPVYPKQRFFWAGITDHGGCYDSNMFPAQSTLTEAHTYASTGHVVRWGPLVGTSNGGTVSLSPALTANSAVLTPKLIGKLNVLRGLDTAIHIGHHKGGGFGNFQDSVGNLGLTHRPTLDQIMAWSPSFYANPGAVRMRSMAYGPSWGFSNPSDQTGPVQMVKTGLSATQLFDKIFVAPGAPTAPVQKRKPIVDIVIENYRQLRDGNRRLSASDRQRLESHMSRLSDVQRRVNQPPVMCGDRPRPTAGVKGSQMNDVFAVAFSCGTSAVATQTFFGLGGAGYHQGTAHQWLSVNSQVRVMDFYRDVFQNYFLDLARKLDAIENTPGRTLLDDSLLMWTQECGMETHWQTSIPVVTAGAAGGFLKTGRFVDYRDMVSPVGLYDLSKSEGGGRLPNPDNQARRHGLLYNQFLATALQAVGVPRNEFERWGHTGYGHTGIGSPGANGKPHAATRAYYSQGNGKFFQIASEPLPVIAG